MDTQDTTSKLQRAYHGMVDTLECGCRAILRSLKYEWLFNAIYLTKESMELDFEAYIRFYNQDSSRYG
jgi:hypothetical protein